MRRFARILLAFLLTGCSGSGPEREGSNVPDHPAGSQIGNSHAERFRMEASGGLRILRVLDPWQNSGGVQFTYVLGPGNSIVPDSLQEYPFIPVPVSRVVAMSTTHLAMISALDREASVVGASGTGFIYNSRLQDLVRKGRIREVGSSQGVNFETLVSVRPDVVFVYGVDGSLLPAVEKLEELGLRVVYCAEYLESHPLGKAEWIRFFASFYGLEAAADSFFLRIREQYAQLRSMAEEAGHRPSVLLGLPWKDTWYVAGGESFAAGLIRDAGGRYLWDDLETAEAVPLDLESVYARAVGADIWINPGAAASLEELVGFDRRFGSLPALQSGKVYNNNARMSPEGGNDYWESATVRPDRVLADLISILHPEILPDHSLFYYRELK